jgi:hypothetical protein
VKQQGSLGFTLQKEDESVYGHFVRALVREPATTDGRIQPGDKIMAVNGVPVSDMTHEQAVIFLRQAPDMVKLRLYRDDGQLSLSATSPSDSDYRSYAGTSTLTRRTKPHLRPEAINLLSDLASKKNTQSSSDGNSANSSFQSSSNTASSPRRLKKNIKHCSITSAPDSDTNNSSDSTLKSTSSIGGGNQAYIITNSGTSSGTMTPYSDSSADTLTVISQSQRMQYYDPSELVRIIPDDDGEGFYDSDELEKLERDDATSPIKRPGFLNLSSQSGSTPVVSRKPCYQFSIATANAYELNNLDNAVLDAPTSYRMGMGMNDGLDDDGANNFTSLPCETLLLACKTEDDLKKSPSDETDTCLYVTKFNRNQPLYQSAQVQINHKQSGNDVVDGAAAENLLKWKGVTMSQDDDDKCSVVSSCAGEYQPMPSIQRISIRNAQKDLNLDEMGIDSKTSKVSLM